MIERDLRKLVRAKWDGWVDWLEPRGNAGLGRPDADFMHEGFVVPVELKIGQRVGDTNDLRCVVRPEQVSWQVRFFGSGGTSMFLVADNPNDIWLGRRIVGLTSKNQWEFDAVWRVDPTDFTRSMKWAFAEAKKITFQN